MDEPQGGAEAALLGPGVPGYREPSRRSYGTAVILSAALGFTGLHHFYLGRIGEGLLDLGLSIAWIYCFLQGEVLTGLVFAVLDFGHAFAVTILLLTGNLRDGDGRPVCYPGQRPRLDGR